MVGAAGSAAIGGVGPEGGVGRGVVAQPAISATAVMPAATPRRVEYGTEGRRIGAAARSSRQDIMGWILLEAALALAIGLLIVWWTWPRKKRPDDER